MYRVDFKVLARSLEILPKLDKHSIKIETEVGSPLDMSIRSSAKAKCVILSAPHLWSPPKAGEGFTCDAVRARCSKEAQRSGTSLLRGGASCFTSSFNIRSYWEELNLAVLKMIHFQAAVVVARVFNYWPFLLEMSIEQTSLEGFITMAVMNIAWSFNLNNELFSTLTGFLKEAGKGQG
ncbi:hypothetical protein Adt_18472 [Abeliophyllum distichum]|uniref:Uncharacterized protein n=1 Tax=Abeliophyllum distichum TaxID=126358 RepID=A0ABD1TJH5_9LAMI